METASIKIARELPFKIERIDQEAGKASWVELSGPPYSLFALGRAVRLERWSVVFTSAVSRAYGEIFGFNYYGLAIRHNFAFGALDYKGDAQMFKAMDGLIRDEEIEVGDYVLWIFDRPLDLLDRRLYELHLHFLNIRRAKQEAEINKTNGAQDHAILPPPCSLS